MNSDEIRSRFIRFFESRGHAHVESSSLIPQNDPTLLFANAGMNQFKDVFLGHESRSYSTAVTVQKCVRAGGKHNDLENVGFTARHHTFFEMMGNFSFGDYFKKDAIAYAWEFVTKELGIDPAVLYVTVFKDDDEAETHWLEDQGVAKDRVLRLGEKDNFWAMGETGPCGPCSEIFVDRGEQYGCGPDCGIGKCDCDRYMEIWNLVFMQFNRDEAGKLEPLPRGCVDTGSGLERVAAVLQKAETNYETDVFLDIIKHTGKLCGIGYDEKADTAPAFRVVADHARAMTFLIADGVMPANEGRGYVLRRIIRRAVRLGKKLNFAKPFLADVCGFVINKMSDAYPNLQSERDLILRCVQSEEEQFLRTLERGLQLLEEETTKLKPGAQLSGEVAFKLYDTYGFPFDLTTVIAKENNLTTDEAGFNKCMQEQRERSRQNWQGSGEGKVDPLYLQLAENIRGEHGAIEFVGYELEEAESNCIALIVVDKSGGRKLADSVATSELRADQAVEAVFARTPFYGESGGQVGDHGDLWSNGIHVAKVTDVQKPHPELIVSSLRLAPNATLSVGQVYVQRVDHKLRQLTMRNHTATHLLHWALRKVLGDHVKQAGSLVTPEYLRFDFTHFQGVTQEELAQVEAMVNQEIWSNSTVQCQEMPKDEAMASGAIAFFGEKYGDMVRVVRAGDHSVEFCGGTHVASTGEIHLVKITSESSVAAGVRRITALSSQSAYAEMNSRFLESQEVRSLLKSTNAPESVERIEKIIATEKKLRKDIEKMQVAGLGQTIDQLISEGKEISPVHLVASLRPPHESGAKFLRELSDQIRQKRTNAVVILGMTTPAKDKSFLIAAVGKEVPKSVQANKLIQTLSEHIGGRGGGKPDIAQAGGPKVDGLPQAIAAAEEAVRGLI